MIYFCSSIFNQDTTATDWRAYTDRSKPTTPTAAELCQQSDCDHINQPAESISVRPVYCESPTATNPTTATTTAAASHSTTISDSTDWPTTAFTSAAGPATGQCCHNYDNNSVAYCYDCASTAAATAVTATEAAVVATTATESDATSNLKLMIICK